MQSSTIAMYAPAVWTWIEEFIYIIVVVHILEKNSAHLFCTSGPESKIEDVRQVAILDDRITPKIDRACFSNMVKEVIFSKSNFMPSIF
jgi:hypothetical protein